MHPLVTYIHLPTARAPTPVLSKPLSKYLNTKINTKKQPKRLHERGIMMYHDVSNSTPHPSAHATPLGLLFFSPQDLEFFLTFVYCCDYYTPYPNHHGRTVDLLRNRVDVGLCCATNMAFSDSVPTLHLPRVRQQSNVARCPQTWLNNFSLDFFCGKIHGVFMELIGG